MPVSGFLSSIADRAQNAINQTPLAGHIHATTPPGGPSASHATSQGGHRSLALESLQHQIRSISQQYTSATPIQRIITLEKGIALDFDAIARDSKAQSKEMYAWGQSEDPDLTDVTDRLAYLNFVHGSLSASLAVNLDSARAPLKTLRDAEAAILPKRNVRAGLRNQIARIEHHQEKGGERRIAELKEQLSRLESNDEQIEKELELLKRKGIRESEERKWEAIREYGEKLVLLSQAAKPVVGALPSLPPTTTNPYAGAQATAAARASLQHALDDYKPGQIDFNLQTGGDLSRSDTRSFGESHAAELDSLAALSAGQDSHPGLPVTPPIPEPAPTEKEDHSAPTPTQLPASTEQDASPVPAQPVSAVVQAIPKTAESPLEDLYGTSPDGAEEGVRAPTAGDEVENGRPSAPESAEEEKKRLEREERERVLASVANVTKGTAERGGDDLPPYEEL